MRGVSDHPALPIPEGLIARLAQASHAGSGQNGSLEEHAGTSDVDRRQAPAGRGLRLLIVDPHSLTRQCLVDAVSTHFDDVVAFADPWTAAEKMPADARCDILIANLGKASSDEALLVSWSDLLSSRFPGGALMLLASSMEPADVSMALGHSVRAYLTQDVSIDSLLSAIHLVRDGWMIHPPVPIGPASRGMEFAIKPGALSEMLTARQFDVLRHLAMGMSNKNIARQLKVSERTVKAHMQEIMHRLGAINRTQIVARLSHLSSIEDD